MLLFSPLPIRALRRISCLLAFASLAHGLDPMYSAWLGAPLLKSPALIEGSGAHLPSQVFKDYLVQNLSRPAPIMDTRTWETRKAAIVGELARQWGVTDYLAGKVPLDADSGREMRVGGYRVREVSFHIGSGVRINGLLYLPADRSGPFPTVVYAEGNIWVGDVHFANANWQSFCATMVGKGYAVLALGGLGCYGNTNDNFEIPWMWRLSFTGPYYANMKGLFPYLQAYRFLAGLSEVDTSRVGISGTSWGGTSAYYAAIFQPGYKAVVSVAAQPTTIAARLQGGLVGTAFRGASEYNLSDDDDAIVYELLAPRPALFISSLHDVMPDSAGMLRPPFERGKSLYALYGRPENLAYAVDTGADDFGQSKRERAYAWFDRSLTGNPTADYQNPSPEPDVATLPSYLLQPMLPAGKSISDLQAETYAALRPNYSLPATGNDAKAFVAAQRQKVAAAFGVDTSVSPLGIRSLWSNADDSVQVDYQLVQTRPGLWLPVAAMTKRASFNGRTVILITEGPDGRSSADANTGSTASELVLGLAAQGYRVVTYDGPGAGELYETDHNTGYDNYDLYYSRSFIANAERFYLGKDHAGTAAEDLLVLAKAFGNADSARGGVHVVACGPFASFVAGLAAAQSKRIHGLVLENYLPNLYPLAEDEDFYGRYEFYQPGFYGITETRFLLALTGARPVFLGRPRLLPGEEGADPEMKRWAVAFAAMEGRAAPESYSPDSLPTDFAAQTVAWLTRRDGLTPNTPSPRPDFAPITLLADMGFSIAFTGANVSNVRPNLMLSGAPAFATWDPISKRIVGKTQLSDSGQYAFTLRDPYDTSAKPVLSVLLRVLPPSAVLASSMDCRENLPPGTAYAGYRFSVRLPIGGSTPILFLSSAPPWLGWDPGTGRISGTPPVGIDAQDSAIFGTQTNLGWEAGLILPIHAVNPASSLRLAAPANGANWDPADSIANFSWTELPVIACGSYDLRFWIPGGHDTLMEEVKDPTDSVPYSRLAALGGGTVKWTVGVRIGGRAVFSGDTFSLALGPGATRILPGNEPLARVDWDASPGSASMLRLQLRAPAWIEYGLFDLNGREARYRPGLMTAGSHPLPTGGAGLRILRLKAVPLDGHGGIFYVSKVIPLTQ